MTRLTPPTGCRPAFIGLVYPVVSLRTSDPGGRAVDALTGENPAPEVIAGRSPLLRISATTPPSFLVHAYDDPVVPPENIVPWAAACRAAGVPVDLHLFAQGGHGFGLHLDEALPGSQWPNLFALWMRRHGG